MDALNVSVRAVADAARTAVQATVFPKPTVPMVELTTALTAYDATLGPSLNAIRSAVLDTGWSTAVENVNEVNEEAAAAGRKLGTVATMLQGSKVDAKGASSTIKAFKAFAKSSLATIAAEVANVSQRTYPNLTEVHDHATVINASIAGVERELNRFSRSTLRRLNRTSNLNLTSLRAKLVPHIMTAVNSSGIDTFGEHVTSLSSKSLAKLKRSAAAFKTGIANHSAVVHVSPAHPANVSHVEDTLSVAAVRVDTLTTSASDSLQAALSRLQEEQVSASVQSGSAAVAADTLARSALNQVDALMRTSTNASNAFAALADANLRDRGESLQAVIYRIGQAHTLISNTTVSSIAALRSHTSNQSAPANASIQWLQSTLLREYALATKAYSYDVEALSKLSGQIEQSLPLFRVKLTNV